MSTSHTVDTWAEVRFDITMCSAVFLRMGDMGTTSTRPVEGLITGPVFGDSSAVEDLSTGPVFVGGGAGGEAIATVFEPIPETGGGAIPELGAPEAEPRPGPLEEPRRVVTAGGGAGAGAGWPRPTVPGPLGVAGVLGPLAVEEVSGESAVPTEEDLGGWRRSSATRQKTGCLRG